MNFMDTQIFNTEFSYMFGYSSEYLISDGKIFSSGEELEQNLDRSIRQALDKSYSQTKAYRTKIVIIASGVLSATVVLLLLYIWLYKRVVRIREERKRRRLEGELRAIRSQMNPHFMFNSLGSIQSLVNQNKVDDANLYLSNFAGLMRKILENSEQQTLPLAEELEAITMYFELEKLRFGFEYNILVNPEIDTQNTDIPGMLIQPLVENAILHGIQPLTDRVGKIDINIFCLNHYLQIAITDNGIGRMAASELKTQRQSRTKGNGKGLLLIKERLEILNKRERKFDIMQKKQRKRYSLALEDITIDGQPYGTKAILTIPLEDYSDKEISGLSVFINFMSNFKFRK